MKICPKCGQSFADGFRYCPKDATELVKYDLRARIKEREELQLLMQHESLATRLKKEFVDAMKELKRHPFKYLISLLRGEGSSRRRRRMLQAGVATALIAYSSIFLVMLLIGLIKLPTANESVNAEPPKNVCYGTVRLVFPYPGEKLADAKSNSQGRLGGSLTQPRRPGGGGGANDQKQASRGAPPTASFNQQIMPPSFDPPKIPNATLITPMTVYADPESLLRMKGQLGLLNGQTETPSRGDGKGTGLGSGNGSGVGPGIGGNVGGGPIKPGGGKTTGTENSELVATRDLKPTILYKEKAKYTEEARQQRVQGSVVLSVTFGADGRVRDIRTLATLPYGLTETAIEAAQRIRFQPAMQNGKPVSVRANLEFNFALY